MVRKIAIVVLVTAMITVLGGLSAFAQEKQPARAGMRGAPQMPPGMAFGMVSGKILKIDRSDPANVKMEVKNDADGLTRTVTLTPNTNITKVTDASELKVGEAVRVMARKADGAEIAMGVMFGNLKPLPAARPIAQAGRKR